MIPTWLALLLGLAALSADALAIYLGLAYVGASARAREAARPDTRPVTAEIWNAAIDRAADVVRAEREHWQAREIKPDAPDEYPHAAAQRGNKVTAIVVAEEIAWKIHLLKIPLPEPGK